MADEKPLCFVICPIGDPGSETRKRSDAVLKHVIRPAAEACGFHAERADESSDPGSITLRIIKAIYSAPMVVADLTDYNANVFYELALRHVARRPFVQIIKQGQKIPFDLGDIKTIPIDLDLDAVVGSKERLVKAIRSAAALGDKIVTHVSVYLDMLRPSETNKTMDRAVVDVLASVEKAKTEQAPTPAAATPAAPKSGLAAWVAANTTPRPPPRRYTREEIQFVTTYASRQQEILNELDALGYKLINAENKPPKLRDQAAIAALNAQIAEAKERLKNFQEEATKVAKETFATDEETVRPTT